MASAKPNAKPAESPLRITPEDVRANTTEALYPGLLEHFARVGLVEIQR